MLFLAWLALSFVVVVGVNLYLRYFGLPRRPLTSAVDGRAYYDRSATLGTGGYVTSSTGAPGGSGAGWTAALFGAGHGSSAGETVRWINTMLGWMWQRTGQTGAAATRPDVVDSWLRALTDEADKQARDVQIRFDGVRGSVPEFANVAVDPQSTMPNTDTLTLHASVTAKDVTLQLCALTHTPMNSTTVFCDVYILHLHGQLKINCRPFNNEMTMFISFVSNPDMRLQILPSARLDTMADMSGIEKAVRVALGGAVTSVTWSSRGAFQKQQQQQQQQLQQQQQQQQMQSRMDAQRSFATPSAGLGPINQQYTGMTPSMTSQQMLQQQNVPSPSSLTDQRRLTPVLPHQQHQQQQPQQMTGLDPMQRNIDQFHGGMQQFNMSAQQQQQQQLGVHQPLQHRLMRMIVKIIKANGLADADFGSNCNAYCVLRVDQPAQNYMTSVIRNTVNPMWDEQFAVEVGDNTRQIQFEVLDRDKPPNNELLGRVTVLLDEVRRMQAGRQILPLVGRPQSRTATSGSITVEFIFVDSMEASGMLGMEQVRSSTPLNVMPAQQTSQMMMHESMPKTDITAGGGYGTFQGHVSAHDMALNQGTQQQVGGRPYDSPSMLMTSTDMQRLSGTSFNPTQMQQQQQQQHHAGMQIRGGSVDMNRGREKKESFATTLKKRLTRGGKKRSQSAERAPYGSHSLREGTYLRPPGSQTTNTGSLGTEQMVYTVEYRVR